MSRGERPRVAPAHWRSVAPAKIACSTGTRASANGPFLRRAGARDREARGVEHDDGLGRAHERADQLRRRRIPQAGDEDGQRVETGIPQRCHQGIDGRERSALQERAVEDHARAWRAVAPVARQDFKVEHALARPVKAGARHRPRRLALAVPPHQPGGVAQRLARVVEATVGAVAPQRLRRVRRERGVGSQPGVRLVVARQPGDGDAAFLADRGQPLDAVGPVALAAEQPHDHQPRAGDHLLGIAVDRKVMAELHEVREPQRGCARAEPASRLGEAGKLGIGSGQQHDVPRRLAEVHGVRAVLDGAGLGGEQVHGLSPLSPRWWLRRPPGRGG